MSKEELFHKAIIELIGNEILRDNFGEELFKCILKIIQKNRLKKYLDWLQTI
jgi:hypothetical protein